MRSMTGHGRGEVTAEGVQLTVEIQSVNRKQLDIVVNLPKEVSGFENQIRSLIQQQITRGRISVSADLSASESRQQFTIDYKLARQYHTAILELQKKLNLPETATLETILHAPGVLHTTSESIPHKKVLSLLERGVKAALVQFDKMRMREGKFLVKALGEHLKSIESSVRIIRKLHPSVLERYRKNLQKRIAQAGFSVDTNDERLLRELAYFADRSDISEELTRLESHLKQFNTLLRSREPIGRSLEFLTQEVQREFNTLGAKANDAEIAQYVIACKSEMEKIREQIQNIE